MNMLNQELTLISCPECEADASYQVFMSTTETHLLCDFCGHSLQFSALAQEQETSVQVPATAPVSEHFPELTVYCPACDFSGATATQHAPDSPDHHITCSNCDFDGDRNKITLVS